MIRAVLFAILLVFFSGSTLAQIQTISEAKIHLEGYAPDVISVVVPLAKGILSADLETAREQVRRWRIVDEQGNKGVLQLEKVAESPDGSSSTTVELFTKGLQLNTNGYTNLAIKAGYQKAPVAYHEFDLELLENLVTPGKAPIFYGIDANGDLYTSSAFKLETVKSGAHRVELKGFGNLNPTDYNLNQQSNHTLPHLGQVLFVLQLDNKSGHARMRLAHLNSYIGEAFANAENPDTKVTGDLIFKEFGICSALATMLRGAEYYPGYMGSFPVNTASGDSLTCHRLMSTEDGSNHMLRDGGAMTYDLLLSAPSKAAQAGAVINTTPVAVVTGGENNWQSNPEYGAGVALVSELPDGVTESSAAAMMVGLEQTFRADVLGENGHYSQVGPYPVFFGSYAGYGSGLFINTNDANPLAHRLVMTQHQSVLRMMNYSLLFTGNRLFRFGYHEDGTPFHISDYNVSDLPSWATVIYDYSNPVRFQNGLHKLYQYDSIPDFSRHFHKEYEPVEINGEMKDVELKFTRAEYAVLADYLIDNVAEGKRPAYARDLLNLSSYIETHGSRLVSHIIASISLMNDTMAKEMLLHSAERSLGAIKHVPLKGSIMQQGAMTGIEGGFSQEIYGEILGQGLVNGGILSTPCREIAHVAKSLASAYRFVGQSKTRQEIKRWLINFGYFVDLAAVRTTQIKSLCSVTGSKFDNEIGAEGFYGTKMWMEGKAIAGIRLLANVLFGQSANPAHLDSIFEEKIQQFLLTQMNWLKNETSLIKPGEEFITEIIPTAFDTDRFATFQTIEHQDNKNGPAAYADYYALPGLLMTLKTGDPSYVNWSNNQLKLSEYDWYLRHYNLLAAYWSGSEEMIGSNIAYRLEND